VISRVTGKESARKLTTARARARELVGSTKEDVEVEEVASSEERRHGSFSPFSPSSPAWCRKEKVRLLE
jgi:hypothetical protein